MRKQNFPRSSSLRRRRNPKPRRAQVAQRRRLRRRRLRRHRSTPAAQLNAKADTFDQARSNLFTTIGTDVDHLTHATINALPGGDNTPVESILLQFPGVSQDSAASGLLHVRNDHANRAISHQWRDAARRPDRLRQHSRRQLDRQPRPGRRRAPGRIRAANGGAGRHHDPRRHFQQQRSSQRLRRQSGNVHADDSIRRHVRQHVSDDNTGSRNPRVAQRGLLSGRPILLYRTLSANQRRPRKFDSPPTARSTTSRNRRKASPICRRSSIRIRGSA